MSCCAHGHASRRGSHIDVDVGRFGRGEINREGYYTNTREKWRTYDLEPATLIGRVFGTIEGPDEVKWVIVDEVDRHPR